MRLRASHLGVAFESRAGRIQAISDISFETGEREFLSVVGPSGCGKTTLLRMLAGLIQPQQGSVESIPSSADATGRVLLVFQENSLFPWMTALENAAFGMEMQGVDKAAREASARRLLRRFGFSGREQAYPHQLSLGMKQRVAVLRSFLTDPAVLLMDEPFAALDCQTRLTLQQELLELWEQNHKSVVFVTHDVEEALLLSDRILVLSPQPSTVIAEFRVPFERPQIIGNTFGHGGLYGAREGGGIDGAAGKEKRAQVLVAPRMRFSTGRDTGTPSPHRRTLSVLPPSRSFRFCFFLPAGRETSREFCCSSRAPRSCSGFTRRRTCAF